MRNEATLNAISAELQRNCGDTLAACRAVGVSLIFVNQWRKDDKIVDEQLTEAERVGTQGLVSAAIQRAVRGVEKGVYFKGEKVDTETVYSDGLLQTLLKAKVPEFAKDGEGTLPAINVNIANIMPRASTYEEWLAMKTQTLPKPAEALSAPSGEALGAYHLMKPPVEAEYEEVKPAFEGIVL